MRTYTERKLAERAMELAAEVMRGNFEEAKRLAPEVRAIATLSATETPRKTYERLSELLDKYPDSPRWSFDGLAGEYLGSYCIVYSGPRSYGYGEPIQSSRRPTCFLLGLHIARLARDGKLPLEFEAANMGNLDEDSWGIDDEEECGFLVLCEEIGERMKTKKEAA